MSSVGKLPVFWRDLLPLSSSLKKETPWSLTTVIFYKISRGHVLKDRSLPVPCSEHLKLPTCTFVSYQVYLARGICSSLGWELCGKCKRALPWLSYTTLLADPLSGGLNKTPSSPCSVGTQHN
jgi:hypothetical protein